MIKIILGLAGLGIVVFVHELGHFIAARLMGIEVEAFSIGWGKPILKKKIGKVEYRIGLFPLGGYCKMKDENEFGKAFENSERGVAAEKGSYFAVPPLKRIVTCLGGPLFNMIFAVLVLSVIWGIGVEVSTPGNRIVLASEITPGSLNPADEAGLKTGDRILSINGQKTETFNEVYEMIAINPGVEMPFQIERNGEILNLRAKPLMEKTTGAGKIGIYAWTDPVIESISEGSAAEIAGLKSGDTILKINGNEFPHTMVLQKVFEARPPLIDIEYMRSGMVSAAKLIPVYTESGVSDTGISWKTINYRTPSLLPHEALVKGAAEAWKTFTLSVKSLALLFKGVDLTKAVSGPVRITYMVGDIAEAGFSESLGAGISSMATFLSLISISLCMMNLLPLPILDGGMILLFLAEMLRGKPLNTRFITVFQTIGVVIIAGLMIFAVFGDILYFTGR